MPAQALILTPVVTTGNGPIGFGDALLLEDGTPILLEDGTPILLE